MMKLKMLLIIAGLSMFMGKLECQLMQHGDSELSQLNLFVKYINESNNVLNLIYSEVANDSTELRDNFEGNLYHISSLTLLDRQTCIFMDAVIKSNSRHYKTEPFISLMTQLELLKTEESKLNDHFIAVTENMKHIDQASLDPLKSYFSGIQEAQAVILETLNNIEFEKPTCELCYTAKGFYNDLNELLKLDNLESSQEQAKSLLTLIDEFDLSSWDEFAYPKKLLSAAMEKMREVVNEISNNGLDVAIRNELLAMHFYTPEGVPQLFNQAFEKYKNQNKESKYINIAAIPIVY